jgi:hypothetical protein
MPSAGFPEPVGSLSLMTDGALLDSVDNLIDALRTWAGIGPPNGSRGPSLLDTLRFADRLLAKLPEFSEFLLNGQEEGTTAVLLKRVVPDAVLRWRTRATARQLTDFVLPYISKRVKKCIHILI